MSFCQNCGQQIPDGAPQCPNCGMPLMQQPVNQQQFAPNMPMQQQPKKKKKGEGCLVAIIIVIALFIFFPKGNGSNKQDGATEQSTVEKTNSENKDSEKNKESTAINKDDYSPIDYNEIIHTADGLSGQKFTCSGKIIQVMSNSYRLSLENKTFDSDVVVIDYKCAEGDRIAEDDYVTIWGVSKGLETYTTVLKSKVTVPRIAVDKLERISEEELSKLKYNKAQTIENNLAGSSEKFHVILQSTMLQHTDQNDIIYLFFEFENITDSEKYVTSNDAYIDGYKTENEYTSEKINGYDSISIESVDAGKKYLGYIKYVIPSEWQTLECTIEDVSFTVQKSEFESESE